MSDQALPQLDLREQIVRMDRAIAEAQKLTWDRWLAPALAIAAVGGLLGIATFIAHLIGH